MCIRDSPYCIGEFVWTGFDYLGAPTPYYTDWPSHSSLFGIIDLAGLPKDRYYLCLLYTSFKTVGMSYWDFDVTGRKFTAFNDPVNDLSLIHI